MCRKTQQKENISTLFLRADDLVVKMIMSVNIIPINVKRTGKDKIVPVRN
jgi:hypothetical protein